MSKSVKNQQSSSYGFPSGVSQTFPAPIIAKRSPSSTDSGYVLGQAWINETSGSLYSLTSISGSGANWSSTTVPTTYPTLTVGDLTTTTIASSSNISTKDLTATGTVIVDNLIASGLLGITATSMDTTDLNVANSITTDSINITGSSGFSAASISAGSLNATIEVTTPLVTITDTGGVNFTVAGSGLSIFSGTNGRAGKGTLVSGYLKIFNDTVTANTLVLVTRTDPGASTVLGNLTVSVVPGQEFIVTSLDTSGATVTFDFSVFTYILIEAL